jgi:diacylglycerol kinase (ATP)
MNNRKYSIRSRYKSFGYAIKGLKTFFSTQPNAIVHLFAAISVIIAGFWFGISMQEWMMLIFAIGMVFTAETFNTSIEFLTDLVSPEYNEKAGKVKDLAAAGVMIAAFFAAIIGTMVLGPYLF